MNTHFSDFGRKLGGETGINALMSDLGEAMAINPQLIMMGGGNPARIPAMEQVWRRRMRELLDAGDAYDRMLANYDQPRGAPDFIDALVHDFNRRFGWGLTRRNVCVTNGSQNSFFFLFNMLAGPTAAGRRRILLPLCPEYIGYADQGIDPATFVSCRPLIEELPGHRFKYRIDFDALPMGPDIAAICVSRPTNPSGNVLTDDEMQRLSRLARENGSLLLVDNAYGAPFPDIIFTEAQPFWDDHVVLTLSLSKLGLPGTRNGIVIAREDVIEALARINAVVSLANGNLGQTLVTPLVRSGELVDLSRQVIRPFYEQRSRATAALLDDALAGLPYRLHVSEGALFLWLWLPGLPVHVRELYDRLRAKNLLVVAGHHFFFGQDTGGWAHPGECIRLTYSQRPESVEKGVAILAGEVRRAFGGG